MSYSIDFLKHLLQTRSVTCFMNEEKLGVTDFFSEIKHVETQSDFEKMARVNQHGIQGCVLAQNINNGSAETNYPSNILYLGESVALIILTLKINLSIGCRNRRTDKWGAKKKELNSIVHLEKKIKFLKDRFFLFFYVITCSFQLQFHLIQMLLCLFGILLANTEPLLVL